MELTRPRLFGLLINPMPDTAQHLKNRTQLTVGWHLWIALFINLLSLALPIMMLQVYDRIIPNQSYGTLILLAVGVGAALVCEILLRFARASLTAWTAARQEHEVGCAAVDHMTRAELNAFERTDAATHLQNMTALSRLREFYSGQAMTAMVDLPFVLIFLGLVAYLGGPLVLVPLTLLAAFAVTATMVGNRLKDALEERSVTDDRKTGFITQILNSIHAAKSFGIESEIVKRYAPFQDEATHASHKVALESGSAGILSAIFGQLSLILTATFGAFMVLNNDLSVGGLTACTLLSGRAIQPIQRVMGTWLRTQDLVVSREQADALFALPQQDRETNELPEPQGKVMFERVSYGVNDKSILKQINLEIEPGEMISINGNKGSGKTTLLQLIAGARIPDSGVVVVDAGINPASYEMGLLKHHIGYMSQTGTIYRGTILDNLTGFDRSDLAITRAQEACRILDLHTVINQLPRGFDTVLGDHNADPVPPGVKQRIALTRVLARDPAILLFDDADRTLDKAGYNALFRYMGACRGRKTVVIATHDHNLLMLAERHYFLDKGVLTLGTSNISFLKERR